MKRVKEKQHMKKVIWMLMVMLTVCLIASCGKSSSNTPKATPVANETKTIQQPKYPNGDITMLVPVKAGGDTDSYARILCKYMTQELGVNVTVENVDGASGTVGARQVYDAKPDGNTLLFFHDAAILSKISGVTDLQLSNYTIVCVPVLDTTSTLVVSAKKFSSPKDFFARAKGGEKIIASVAAGSLAALAPLELQKALGCTFKYVDSTSAADRIADLLAGRIDIFYTQYGTIKQYIQKGDFLSLGVMADERNKNFPEVPTLKEQGVDISMPKFFYVACPPKTPEYVVTALSSAIKKCCENPKMQEDLAKFFVSAKFMTPAESLDFVKNKEKNYESFADLLK